MNKITQFRFPTILGLSIIIMGLGAGVFLTLQQQTIKSKASADQNPKNIVIANLQDTSVSISWSTDVATNGFINYGTTDISQVALDDLDNDKPTPHQLHHVSIKNLTPQTKYQVKINSGETTTDSFFSTAPEDSAQNGFLPVIGTVVDDNRPLTEGLVYLQIQGATPQSAIIKSFGAFLIPISSMRTNDLTRIFSDRSASGQITVITANGQKATATISLSNIDGPIGPLKIGQDLDFSKPAAIAPTIQELVNFDLNGDGQINANDYAFIVTNLGNKPKKNTASSSADFKKSDLNGDGKVDQNDLNLIQAEVNKNQ